MKDWSNRGHIFASFFVFFFFFYISAIFQPQLEEERRQRRQSKLRFIADMNERRCAACPLYGEDLFMALRIGKPATACPWHNDWMHCATVKQNVRTRREFFSRTEALAEAIKSTERIVEELKEVFERLVLYQTRVFSFFACSSLICLSLYNYLLFPKLE